MALPSLAGNLFFGDGSTIRKLCADGTITTVAGSGTNGYSGDGGPAIKGKSPAQPGWQYPATISRLLAQSYAK